MHDPMTQVWASKHNRIVIWHIDPDHKGDDDSCGWFMRSRHGDPAVLEKIKERFEFSWDRTYEHGGQRKLNGYFDPVTGDPQFSAGAIALELFFLAALVVFKRRTRAVRFMRKGTFDILHFAENPIDSLHPMLTCQYGREKRQDRIEYFASCIYGWILREQRPWYRHPRWHIWHWQIQLMPVLNLKRWLWSRCERCGGRFRYGENPTTYQWDGTGPRWFRGERNIFHGSDCSESRSTQGGKSEVSQ